MTSTSETPPAIRDPATVVSVVISTWEGCDFGDEDLWEAFGYEFEGYTEDDFINIPNSQRQKLRNFLRKQGVWISKDKRFTIAKSLCQLLEEENPSPWTEEEIKLCDDNEEFTTTPRASSTFRAACPRASSAFLAAATSPRASGLAHTPRQLWHSSSSWTGTWSWDDARNVGVWKGIGQSSEDVY